VKSCRREEILVGVGGWGAETYGRKREWREKRDISKTTILYREGD